MDPLSSHPLYNPVDDFEFTCRICLDSSNNRHDFIAPCRCRGTSKWVHPTCLNRWRVMREEAFLSCTECHYEYKLKSLLDPEQLHDPSYQWERKMTFIYYIIFDVILALFISQCAVISFSYLIYLSDSHSKALISAFNAILHPMVFYYLFSFSIILALLGLILLMQLISGNACCEFCGRSTFCGDTFFITTVDPTCCPVSGHCLECSTLNCTECCVAGNVAGEIILIVFVLLAIAGLFVAIFAGILYIQQVIQKHIHLIERRNISKEQVVVDLDNDIEHDGNFEMKSLYNQSISRIGNS